MKEEALDIPNAIRLRNIDHPTYLCFDDAN